MSDAGSTGHQRPPDPAGTRPKVDPRELAEEQVAPLLVGAEADTEAVEIDEDGQEIAEVEPVPSMAGAGDSRALSVRDSGGGLARPALQQSSHAPRFQFLFGVLLALAASAIVLVAAVFQGGRTPPPPRWSSWHPTGSGYAGAEQIAIRVGSEYRLPDGGPLLGISGGPPQYAGIPASLAIVTGSSGSVLVVPGSTVLYRMCGARTNCQIRGKPSSQRLLLVRRQALELALYTFHYLGADNVLVELPPLFTHVRSANGRIKTQIRHNAAFFTSQQLSSVLSRPLNNVLTTVAPRVDTVTNSPDSGIVEALTARAFVNLNVRESAQDGNLYFVLQPLAIG